MKKIIANIVLVTMLVTPFAATFPLTASASDPTWDTTGSYVINMNYLGTDYAHDMNLTQTPHGNETHISGNGGSPAGSNTYTWEITTGTLSGNTVDFHANYTATADAVTPQTILHVVGTIAQDGTMSGTWSDNYQGQDRSGTWMSTSGHATLNPSPQDPGTVTVTIVKYIDGQMATAALAQNMDFPMTATWNAQNIGQGTGQYSLSAAGFNGGQPYQAQTVDMTSGANYSTNEMTGSSVVGDVCNEQVTYALTGYSIGDSLSEAQQATPSTNVPSFTNMTSDKFVIVRNVTCNGTGGSNDDGTIDGDVTHDADLHVDSITVVDSTATANGTWADGWKYIFHITAPTSEPNIAMKFSDWSSGANSITVGNNMRISSSQANNAGATILIPGANTYSTPVLNMTDDLDPTIAGRQLDITVEVSVPVGTVSGSYTTTYGISSNM